MIRRILMAVINADHPQKGMEHAFHGIFGRENISHFDYLAHIRNGKPKEEVNLDFVHQVLAFRPDWIWMQLQMTKVLDASSIYAIKKVLPTTVMSHWMGDMRETIDPYLADVSRACHLTLASSEGQLESFRAVGAPRAEYCQIGVDWQEDVQGEVGWEPSFRIPDVVFCGTNYGNAFPGTVDREAMAQALVDAKIDFGIVGHGWNGKGPVIGSCHVKHQSKIYQRCKIAINVNHFNDVRRYYSDRLLIAMASGKPVVAKWVPGMDMDFTPNVHLFSYDTMDNLIEIVRMLLQEEGTRTKVGARGREEILRRHTWFSRILEVLPIVEEIRSGL